MRAIPIVFALGLGLSMLSGCSNKVPEPTSDSKPITSSAPPEPEPADLISEDVSVGEGQEAKTGDKVYVHYTGRLKKNGVVFDSSVGKKPLDFTLGKKDVIQGWDQGVVGMKVGGKRKLTIPSKLAYGDAGSPPKIPPKATLVFDIELLSIGEPPGAKPAPSGSASAGAAKKDTAKKDTAKKEAPKP